MSTFQAHPHGWPLLIGLVLRLSLAVAGFLLVAGLAGVPGLVQADLLQQAVVYSFTDMRTRSTYTAEEGGKACAGVRKPNPHISEGWKTHT